MKVTAVVVAHEKSRIQWLEDALSSIYDQTRKADKVILIGDYQYEGQFLHEENFLFIPMPSVGISCYYKFDYAVQFLNTDAVFFLCDDDLLAPSFVEKTLGVMENTGCDVVYTDWMLFGIDNRFHKSGDWTSYGISVGGCVPITAMTKTAVFDKVKYRDIVYGDWDFWWSAFDAGYAAQHVHEPLFLYRTHLLQGSREVDVEKHTKEVLDAHS